MTKKKTIVLLSGGMNSAAFLLANVKKLSSAEIVECMIFDHGQIHAEEVDAARSMCDRLKVPSSLWSLETQPLFDIGISGEAQDLSLTKTVELIHKSQCFSLMIINAIYRVKRLGADEVVAGFIESEVPFDWNTVSDFWRVGLDMGGYPLSVFTRPQLYMPFFYRTKIDVFEFAEQADVLGEVLRDTVSCMNGNTTLQHPWGYGCGSCGGCVRRWRAWEEYRHQKS